ncbi:SDR family oxidoreductase [Shinella sp. CPCC 100929]|uniref:SDR family oxidoreductase n=1 Tax=Shinella lacus TaxID=2654216 RepID=A0ABT1REM8_9HYPH|nr:SDR family oxidoreductase [Shinella lacus]MCQ4633446.1 SDR family oxidoreductase [Shinella lacus]
MDKPLRGQTVLVTGASGGIGAAIVERLALEGARPIIHYFQDEHAAETLLARVGGNGLVVQADLSDVDGPCALWRKAIAFAGRVHGVVNNAGIRTEIPIEHSSADWKAAWHREFQLNVFAAADLCREAIRHFRTEGGGRIVNMAGQAGQRGSTPDMLPHGATKAALINLTKSIAYSFGREGVMAMSIAPGLVRTEMTEKYIAAHDEVEAVGEIPIGDMAEPTEIAELVAFLLRHSQDSLNGATLDVNGGSYIR